MSEHSLYLRKLHFERNWLAWVAVHHFLSAGLIRELSHIVVDRVSDGAWSLEQLFEETLTDGPDCMECWLVRPLVQSAPLARYLQQFVQTISWQSDAELSPFALNQEAPACPAALSLAKAFRIGSADFNWSESAFGEFVIEDQESIRALIRALLKGRSSVKLLEGNAFVSELTLVLEPIELPLKAVIVKHLGDLCADIDAWDKALALYNEAERLLSIHKTVEWAVVESSLQAMIAQSRAAAVLTIDGEEQAAGLLTVALSSVSLKEAPQLHANASTDALTAAQAVMRNSFQTLSDRRAFLLPPPLLLRTQNRASAIEAWLDGHFTDSHRRFWAVLRRQTALGSAGESRATKALYAISIFRSLEKTIARQRQPQSFQTAVRLLLESGDSSTAEQSHWTEQFADTYVDKGLLEFVVSHTNAHPGSQLERQRVVIELFRSWLETVRPDSTEVAGVMLKYIAKLAKGSVSSFYGDLNLGGRSLEVLNHVGQKRPEFRYRAREDVTAAVIQKLQNAEFWTGRSTALEVASTYSDAFSAEELQSILEVTLKLLEEIDPKAHMWPVVRPALSLLVLEPAKRVAKTLPELARRIVATILRFGLEQETEHARVLFYLHDFDPALLRDTSVVDKLRSVIADIRHQAGVINASNAVEHIQALLIAPVLSGVDGVKDALASLGLILDSAGTKRISMSLPMAYQPLLLLSDKKSKMAEELALDAVELKSWFMPLFAKVVRLWEVSASEPQVFATFSFPPATRPNSVIAHNWALASLLFAESLGLEETLFSALAAASVQPEIADAIALARATRSVARGEDMPSAGAIRLENRETFYAALGRRLAALQRVDDVSAQDVCKALVDQCFRQGPRDLDAAVLLEAIRLRLVEYVGKADHSDYAARVENDRDLRMSLYPLLDIVGIKLRH